MKTLNKNILILFFTLVVVMLGFGMVIPIMPFYVKSLGASGAALGALMATYAVMQFLFAPVWGSFSDRYGRKPILILGIFGNAIAQLLFGLSTQLWMLFAARILAGILSSATLPTAMAYVSDSTTARERGGGMGIMGAAMGIGMVLGPGIAGMLAKNSLATPFFLAAGLSMLALLLILAILPESLPIQERGQVNGKLQGPQFQEMWRALFGPIGLLLFISFLTNFGLTNFESVFGLFALERYNYGPEQVGGLLTYIGLLSAIIQGALTGLLTRQWGEIAIIKISLLASALAFPIMLLAKNLPGILVTVGFFILSNSLMRPATSSLLSKRANMGQGVAMGLNNSFMSVGRAIGPLMAGFLFDMHSSLPYISGGVIMLVGYVISFFWLGRQPEEEQ